jgi:hypothetical protein
MYTVTIAPTVQWFLIPSKPDTIKFSITKYRSLRSHTTFTRNYIQPEAQVYLIQGRNTLLNGFGCVPGYLLKLAFQGEDRIFYFPGGRSLAQRMNVFSQKYCFFAGSL